MKVSKASLFLIVVLLSSSFNALADYSCTLDLRMGVTATRQHVRILEADRTILQINQARQLFILGKLQNLNQRQQDLLYYYATGLHDVVPEISLLAKEGVGLVTDNITRIYSGLVGQNSDSTEELFEAMTKVKKRVKGKFGRSGNYYFINPGKLENEELQFQSSLQAQIESGFSNVSGILSAIGTFDNTIDSQESNVLRKRARIACKKLHKLNEIETALLDSYAALRQYDVIVERHREKQQR